MTINKEVFYEKLGYISIFKDKTDEEKLLLQKYLLPLKLNFNKKTYEICKCGYYKENLSNKKCLVCMELIDVKKSFSEKHIEDNKIEINIIDNLKNDKDLFYFLNGFITLSYDENSILILDNSNLKEQTFNIDIIDNVYKFYLNNVRMNEYEFLLLLKSLKLNNDNYNSYNQEEKFNNEFFKLFINLNKQLKDKKVESIFEKIISKTKELEKLKIANNKYYKQYRSGKIDYREYLNKTKKHDEIKLVVKNLKDEYIQCILNSLLNNFYKDNENIDKELYNLLYKENLYLNSLDIINYIDSVKFITNDFNNFSSFENRFNIPKDLYYLIENAIFDDSKLKYINSLSKIKKEKKSSILKFFKEINKLDNYELTVENLYKLLLILNKIEINIDELIDYMNHLIEQEGLVGNEIIQYYYKYVNKKTLKVLKEIPMPVNLKLNANK